MKAPPTRIDGDRMVNVNVTASPGLNVGGSALSISSGATLLASP
jgi:hypothetical protein